MKETLQKKAYKYTFYQLDSYYHFSRKSLVLENGHNLSNDINVVNHSNYKKIFTFKFKSESDLKRFLRKKYPNRNSVVFTTNLGLSIKNIRLDYAPREVAVVTYVNSTDTIEFNLKDKIKVNKIVQKSRKRYFDHYSKNYDWLAREIKKKCIEKYILRINPI